MLFLYFLIDSSDSTQEGRGGSLRQAGYCHTLPVCRKEPRERVRKGDTPLDVMLALLAIRLVTRRLLKAADVSSYFAHDVGKLVYISPELAKIHLIGRPP